MILSLKTSGALYFDCSVFLSFPKTFLNSGSEFAELSWEVSRRRRFDLKSITPGAGFGLCEAGSLGDGSFGLLDGTGGETLEIKGEDCWLGSEAVVGFSASVWDSTGVSSDDGLRASVLASGSFSSVSFASFGARAVVTVVSGIVEMLDV
jgi:hypothetical protein